MTLPLPWGDVEDPQVMENFRRLAQQFPVGGNNLSNDVLRLATTGTSRKVDFGAASCTWTASQFSATTILNHVLGTTPVVMVAMFDSGSGNFPFATWLNATSTTFSVRGWNPAAISATLFFTWVAIG